MTSQTAILRTNRNFRLLFFGQTVSQLGDWFNSVAVFALLLDLTGSATAVAWMMIVQFLPMAVIGPIAGVVVDRVDRRRIMIAADLVRGVLVLGLLLVRTREQVWLAYVVMALTVSECQRGSFAQSLSPHPLTAARVPSARRWCRAKTFSSPSSNSIASDSRRPYSNGSEGVYGK